MTDVSALLPDLAEWNDGSGISPGDWLGTVIRSDQAVAYALLFWPTFVEHENYIFRDEVPKSALKEWERHAELEPWQIEAELNTLFLDDLLFINEAWSPLVEKRAVFVGRILREIYSAKLARDFPGRRFIVELWDGSRPGNDEISLSFWQQP